MAGTPPRSPPPTRFRLKCKSKPRPGKETVSKRPRSSSNSSSASYPSKRSHRRSHGRYGRDRGRSPPHADFHPNDHYRAPSPNTEFRESLFDALADDEGAAYWEGVYGQPLHTYSRYRPATSDEGPATDADGKPILERMTDEEYTAYVRGRMWEKSHAYIAEERLRREEARERKKKADNADEAARRVRSEKAAWYGVLNAALGRRRERERDGGVRKAWEGYLRRWDELRVQVEVVEKAKKERLELNADVDEKEIRIPWPTASARSRDINPKAVEDFFRRGVATTVGAASTGSSATCLDLAAVVKIERVRWHPDKMQQRFGALGISEATMKKVTAVFQIVDRLWTSMKDEASY